MRLPTCQEFYVIFSLPPGRRSYSSTVRLNRPRADAELDCIFNRRLVSKVRNVLEAQIPATPNPQVPGTRTPATEAITIRTDPDSLNLSSEVSAVVRLSLMREGSRTILWERLDVPGCFWVLSVSVGAHCVSLADLYAQRTMRRTIGLMAKRQKMLSRTSIVCTPPRRRLNSGSLFWAARTIL
jgi:hypothetical protein